MTNRMIPDIKPTRRGFIGSMASLPVAGVMPLPARAAQNADYKALVCIYLEGGWDNWSAFVPFDELSHAGYGSARPDLAISRQQLSGTVLQPRNDLSGRQFAFHPALLRIHNHFHEGNLAVLQNVGPLRQPVSKNAIYSGTASVPTQLFSHNHQASYVLRGGDGQGATGWGGRIADHVASFNARPALTCLDATTRSPFLQGDSVSPYAVNEYGAAQLLEGEAHASGLDIQALIEGVSAGDGPNPLRQAHGEIVRRALDFSGVLGSTFAGIPDSAMPELSSNQSDLAHQLRAIARAIAIAPSLGMRRQVFFARMRGWDTHSGGQAQLAQLFGELDEALSGFHRLLQRWALSSSVTTFTASDFGRTLAGNGDGSDHGWGGVSLILGGAVNGGRILGKSPAVGIDTIDTLYAGRLIPTTSIDQLSATLAQWMGVSSHDLASIAPHMYNFPTEAGHLPVFHDDMPS